MPADNKIILKDEKGNDFAYEVLDIVLYKEKVYCVCYSKELLNTEVLILRVETKDKDYDRYVVEEDEEKVNSVFNIFKEKNKNNIVFK